MFHNPYESEPEVCECGAYLDGAAQLTDEGVMECSDCASNRNLREEESEE